MAVPSISRIDVDFYRLVYDVNVHGTKLTVTVTDTPSVVRKWLRSVLFNHRHETYRNRLIVELGVQWTPGGEDPPAATLQLCIGSRCLLLQLAHAERVPLLLRRFLLNPNHTCVGFWNHSDWRKLKRSVHNLEMYKDPLDLRLHVETKNGESLAQASVNEIVKECLGFEVDQSGEISTMNWNYEYLSSSQVVYPCVDAYRAFLIGKVVGA